MDVRSHACKSRDFIPRCDILCKKYSRTYDEHLHINVDVFIVIDFLVLFFVPLLISNKVLRVNTLRPRQHGRHFADDTFKRIFLDENVAISIKISLKFIYKGPINNILALVQIMADQATSHYLNQWWVVYWRIYASPGLNELKPAAYTQPEDVRWLTPFILACLFLCMSDRLSVSRCPFSRIFP